MPLPGKVKLFQRKGINGKVAVLVDSIEEVS
jgi:hypothetical protein